MLGKCILLVGLLVALTPAATAAATDALETNMVDCTRETHLVCRVACAVSRVLCALSDPACDPDAGTCEPAAQDDFPCPPPPARRLCVICRILPVCAVLADVRVG